MKLFLFVLFFCYLYFANATYSNSSKCNVRVKIDSGWVCGLIREAELGRKYASFRKIPYAEPPLGKMRFQELQPVQPWVYDLDATEEGPRCPQDDPVFSRLLKDGEASESCIFVNVHVPIGVLPKVEEVDYYEPYGNSANSHLGKDGIPILVYIHGGGFSYGSGSSTMYGPEYLVAKGVMVITFNYRLNVFGFFSLNTPKIPGNAGLRDQMTLLRWVKRNARAFGGNPNEVTLGGVGSGAVCAHLLALSKETEGLFKRVILMSGTAITAFYTASPVHASIVAAKFLKTLGLNETDPDVIHDQLAEMPIERIMNANCKHQEEVGLIPFSPVVEAYHPNVVRIVDDDPMELIRQGRDKQYPMIIGSTNNECEFARYALEYLQMLRRIDNYHPTILAARIPYSTTPYVAEYLAQLTIKKYFRGKLNYNDYMVACSNIYFEYPAFQLARWRSRMGCAPSFLYRFEYVGECSVIKEVLYMDYNGTAHFEDVPYIFRENAMLGNQKAFPPQNRDDLMKDWVTNFVVKFMVCGDPTCDQGWPAVDPSILNYQWVFHPGFYTNTKATHERLDMILFNDMIDGIARISRTHGTNTTDSW